MLKKNQFDILECLINNQAKKITQRELSNLTSYSLGTVNTILKELIDSDLVSSDVITDKGYEVMEKYHVKRAVIIAAGFGSRLVPITLNTPKPLVRVKGKRIIDSCLDALKDSEINEVYIVRGYLGEQFDQLLYSYPNIKFIENVMYNEANNISSIVCSKDLLENSYVIEADLLLYNKSLIKKYQYYTNYLGIPVKRTDDWCFYVKNQIINKMSIGGENCFKMVGISYWNKEDGNLLGKCVQKVFDAPGGKERYWDQVPLEYYLNDFKIRIRECCSDDVVEIDTFNELKELDKSYSV